MLAAHVAAGTEIEIKTVHTLPSHPLDTILTAGVTDNVTMDDSYKVTKKNTHPLMNELMA